LKALIGAAKSFDGPGFPAHPQQSIVPLVLARLRVVQPMILMSLASITNLLVHFTLHSVLSEPQGMQPQERP